MKWAERTFVHVHVSGGPEFTIRLDGQHSNGAAAVIGYKHIATGRVNADVGRPVTLGTNGVELGEVAGGTINCVGTDGAGAFPLVVVNFVAGIQMRLGRIESEPGGVPGIFEHLALGEGAGCRVRFKKVDALAAAWASFRALRRTVGAHVDQPGLSCGLSLLRLLYFALGSTRKGGPRHRQGGGALQEATA